MNIFLIFVSSFLILSSSASNAQELDIKSNSDQINERTDESTVVSAVSADKCSKEIESLKRNITELHEAYMKIQNQLEHLNQHLTFHEKALKHIAIWSHRRNGHHHNDNPITDDNQDVSGRNESESNEQKEGTDQKGKAVHHHMHHQHHHHHHHRPHHSPNQIPCNQCPHGVQAVSENPDHNQNNKKLNKDKEKDSSEENSSEEQESKPSVSTVLPNSEFKDNESIALNDSQTNGSQKSPKKVQFSKPSVEEQLYFQSMQSEFKEWFTNMLDDIHHNHGRVDRSHNGLKVDRRLDQSAIDDMENTLNNEELIFATCSVKPNRHIALLSQQEVEGTINMWQLKHNRGPLHMHIKLKGFKVSNHVNGHQNAKLRRVRESILMPVEVEPEESKQPIGASHSHGFHVHEFGNLSRGCQSVGNHYNPLNLTHGGPYDVVRHVGDLGNIRCDRNGEIDSELTYTQISLSGIHSIINRSLVIHSNIDDYGRDPNSPSSAKTGSSGVRIACCLIEEVKQFPKEKDSESNIGSVASPVFTSKRRRDTSRPLLVNKYRFDDQTLSEILEKIENYENNRKYKKMDFN